MLRRIIQILFLLIGATVGIIFLPYVFELIPFLDNPWSNNAIVAALVGAIVFSCYLSYLQIQSSSS